MLDRTFEKGWHMRLGLEQAPKSETGTVTAIKDGNFDMCRKPAQGVHPFVLLLVCLKSIPWRALDFLHRPITTSDCQ